MSSTYFHLLGVGYENEKFYVYVKPKLATTHTPDNNEELLPKTLPKLQMSACANTLINLLIVCPEKFNFQEKNIIQQTAFFSMKCGQSPYCNTNSDLAKNIVRTTVSLLDIFVLDEMCAKDNMGLGAKVYGRAGFLFEEESESRIEFSDQPLIILPKEVVRTHYARRQEMPAHFKELAENTSFLPLNSLDELRKLIGSQKKSKPLGYYLTYSLLKSEINEAMYMASKNPHKVLILPFHMNDELSGFALSGKRIEKIDKQTFLPQSEPSHQEVLEALLLGGLPLIKDTKKLQISQNNLSEDDRFITKKEAFNRLQNIWETIISLIPLTDVAGHINVQQSKTYSLIQEKKNILINKQLIKILIKNYLKFFINKPQIKRKLVDIYLTRTGLSATTLGVYLAVEYFGGNKKSRPLAYINKGFYYEAESIASREFNIAKKPTEKNIRVFCINVSSNPPYSSINRNFNYRKHRDALISLIIKTARKHPKNDYFLIVDITTNLLFKTIPNKKRQPKNLYLFEAASLTKYRHGDHNHFSGIIAYRGDKKIKPLIKKMLAEAFGITSQRDLCFFQTLDRTEIRKTILSLKKKGYLFTKSFTNRMKKLPKRLRWKIERNIDSPQYIYLIPPMDAMIKTAKKKYFPQTFYRNIKQKDGLKKIHYCYKIFFKKIIKSVTKPFQTTPGYEVASSFGLNTSRVTFIPGEFHHAGDIFSQKISRVSFGLKTPVEELEMFGRKVADALIKKTIKMV